MIKQREFIPKKGPLKGKKITWNNTLPMKINRSDPKARPAQHVINRAYAILHDIVEPTLGLKGISADIYMTRLDDYALNERDLSKILAAIATKYHVDRDYLDCLKKFPIGLIALYTLNH